MEITRKVENNPKRFLGCWEKRNASGMRQNCVKNARNTSGGEHLLDDTEIWGSIPGLGSWLPGTGPDFQGVPLNRCK